MGRLLLQPVTAQAAPVLAATHYPGALAEALVRVLPVEAVSVVVVVRIRRLAAAPAETAQSA
jgi:hypothetical protein